MVDMQLVAMMANVHAEITSILSEGSSLRSLELSVNQQQLESLMKQHPEEAKVFLHEFQILPFYNDGAPQMKEIEGVELSQIQKGTPTAIQKPIPDGPRVRLVYLNGQLLELHWLIGNKAYDISHQLFILNGSVPRFIQSWSDHPHEYVEGILAITKSDARLLNEVNLRPVDEHTISFDAVKNLFNQIYRGMVYFFSFNKDEFFPVNESEFFLDCSYGTNAVGQPTYGVTQSHSVFGTVTGFEWKQTLSGYLYLELKVFAEGGEDYFAIPDFYQLLLKGLTIGNKVRLSNRNNQLSLTDFTDLNGERKVFPPKFSPVNKSKVMYEGSNGMTLFIRDPEADTTLNYQLFKIFERNVFGFDQLTIKIALLVGNLSNLLVHADFSKSYPLDEVLWGLGIPGLNQREAHLIAKAHDTIGEALTTLSKSSEIAKLGIEWLTAYNIAENVNAYGDVYQEFTTSLSFDYDAKLKEPKVIGIIGSFKITRHELQTYFLHEGVELVDDSLCNLPVIIAGGGVSAAVSASLEAGGIMIIQADSYLDINLLIHDTLKHL